MTVNAALFNLGSTDAGTPPGGLVFSFASDNNVQTLTFDCDAIGTQAFELWVTDPDGNQDFCTSFVNVQDGDGVCNDGLVDIGGSVRTLSGDPLSQTTVALNGSTAVLTGPDGQFLFSDQPGSGGCTVQAARELNFTEGVSTYDLVVLRAHVLGVAPITDPYLLLAADANGSGDLTILDVVEIQKVILYINPSFTNQRNWQFIPTDYVFADPTNPFAEAVPDSYTWPTMSADVLDADFTAVKTGDINGSINVPQLDDPHATDRAAGVTLPVADRFAAAGTELEVRIPTAGLALQSTFALDPAYVELVAATPTDRVARIDERHLTALWYAAGAAEEPWLTLRVRTKRAGRVSDWLRLSDRYTPPAAFRDETALPLTLDFRPDAAAPTAAFSPNPLTSSTRIRVACTTDGVARLRVYDASGRLVYNSTKMWKKGPQEWRLRRNDLPGPGVYYYQLQTPANGYRGHLTAF